MNKIIFFVAVSSLLVLSTARPGLEKNDYGDKLAELVKTLHATCVTKSGTDEPSIAKVMKGEFTDEPKIKAYMKCLLQESTAIDEKGNWNMEMATEVLPAKIKDQALSNIKNCDSKTSSIANVDDRVFAFLKCTYELNPDIFIFF